MSPTNNIKLVKISKLATVMDAPGPLGPSLLSTDSDANDTHNDYNVGGFGEAPPVSTLSYLVLHLHHPLPQRLHPPLMVILRLYPNMRRHALSCLFSR